MFTPEDIIDYVQNTKKQVVTKLVTNEAIADSLTKFIDVEADYTKSALKSFTVAATDMYVASTQLYSAISKKFDSSK